MALPTTKAAITGPMPMNNERRAPSIRRDSMSRPRRQDRHDDQRQDDSAGGQRHRIAPPAAPPRGPRTRRPPPPLAHAAARDAGDLDRLHGWLQQAGARWGLDAKHRDQHQAPADDAYPWQFALDRLVLGHATGSAADLAGGGVAPWIELEGGALEALDRLLRLLRVLAVYQRRLGELLTPARQAEPWVPGLAPTATSRGSRTRSS
ncbi:hypothetical protein G6F40_014056 [Rhizopus arrhizus]|nr:hypothetical protein G6F40_014056 [Rhizopus arrhizus]